MKAADRVIVVGAGIAGLGAARALANRGIDVTVLEARDRIAGRAWTSDAWPDLPVDMGASWIHGVTGNPLSALADKVGVEPILTNAPGQLTLGATGEALDYSAMSEEAERIVEAARDAVDDNGADMSLRDAVLLSAEWKALTETQKRLLRLAIHTTIEHEYSGDWARLSAWYFDDGDDFPGDDAVFARGFAPLMSHLAEGLDIRLNEPALRIEPAQNGVTVVTEKSTHFAGKVIVTLPLGVLQSGTVEFGAPLKKKRQKAIDRLEMGLLNKCWLRFDQAFWPDDVDWVEFLGDGKADEPGHWSEFTSFLRPTGVPLLVGFNAAAPAEAMEALDDDATAESAMAALRTMFGNGIPDPVAYQVTRWRQDPYALGAYSFQPVGTKAKTRRSLFGGDWKGTLFFAGEAASHDHPGTLHGALMTGRSVADMI